MTSSTRNMFAILGTWLLAIPLALTLRWFIIAPQYTVHEERVAAFMRFLPEVLHDTPAVPLTFLICALAAVLVGVMCIAKTQGFFKFLCILNILLGTLLFLWQIWTML